LAVHFSSCRCARRYGHLVWGVSCEIVKSAGGLAIMATILVVDDDRAVQEMLTDVLQHAGYEVDTCRDGRKVMPRLEERSYDLVILDVLIPHMNGFTLIEQIRAHPELRELPVVMISGIYRSRNHRTEMAQRFGVADYLDKPLNTAKLIELAGKLTGQAAKRGAAPMGEERTLKPKAPPPPSEDLVDLDAQNERRQVEVDSRENFRTSAFILQGSIRRNAVPGVLGKLWKAKRSGALLLRSGKVKKIIYVKKGDAYAVKSNLVSECLGQLLVSERMISEHDCARSIQLMKETGRRQGEILVDMRCITDRNLSFALELQLETKIFETFKWEDGDFRFNGSVDLPPAGVELEWAGASLVVEGIRRSYDETRLRSLMLPILDELLAVAEPAVSLEGLKLDEREQKAVDAMLAILPVSSRALLDAGELDPPDMLRLIYTLIALEIVGPQS
jgi:DNA-binding response OmpR family regulator